MRTLIPGPEMVAAGPFLQTIKQSVRSLLFDGTCLSVFGGIGDDLLLTAVARELKRRGRRNVFVLTEHPELFAQNPDITLTARRGSRREKLVYKMTGSRR